MSIFIILMVLTILVALALLVVLVIYLNKINLLLANIGGTAYSFLAKIRVGLRAIRTETGHLQTEVTSLNAKLNETADGLKTVEVNLKETMEHLSKQAKR